MKIQNLILSVILFSLFLLPLSLAGSVTISWQVLDSYIRPNGETTILLTMTNPSTSTGVNTVRLYISPGSYLSTSITSAEIGGIGTSSSQQTSFTVKADTQAISTTSYIKVKATYYDDSTVREITVNIPIAIKREPLLQIENVDYSGSTEPGNPILLLFVLSNYGDGPAKDLRVILNQSSMFTTIGSNEILINELKLSEKTRVEFPIRINPDADIGVGSAVVTLNYFDETKKFNYTVVKSIGMSIAGEPELIVAMEDTKNLYFGKTGTVSISISNTGSDTARFLTVTASSDFGKKDFYIGNLDPDDDETIELPQNLATTKEPYNILLEMKYKDNYNKEFTIKETLEVTPTQAPVEIPNYLIVIVIILAVFGFWYLRKRKK